MSTARIPDGTHGYFTGIGAMTVWHPATTPEPDPIGLLAKSLRDRLARGEVVMPILLTVMDDLMPGWRDG